MSNFLRDILTTNKLSIIISLSSILTLGNISYAQLSGTYSIPDDYATISAAVTELNTSGVSGSVIFNVDGAFSESITSPILLTATGTSSNTITFQKTGGSPTVTRTDAGSLATSTLGGQGDAVIIIQGGDYITFDGISVAASQSGIEYGYYLRKASATNGCKNATIKNCSITMTKSTSGFVAGIYSSNNDASSSVSSATGITITSTGGRNENVTITGNTISNVFTGILLRGFNHTASPYDFYDQNFIVGQSGAGNLIQNFAGNTASAAYGVYLIYHNNSNISYNTINNTAGGGSAFTSTGYGIFHSTATNASATYNYNNITLSSTTGQLRAIMFGTTSSGVGDYTCNNNTISLTMAGTTEATHIYATGTVNSFTINNNTFSYGTFASTIASYCIYASTATNTVTISGNQTSGAISKTGAGTFYFYYNFGSPTGGTETITNNTFSNFTATTGSSALYGIYSNTAVAQNRVCSNNTTSNLTHSGTGLIYGLTAMSGGTNQVNDNNVYSITGGGTIYGLYFTGTNPTVYNNNVYNITTSGTTLYGIYDAGTGTTNCYKNQVYNLIGNNASPTLYGFYITTGTANYVYNNFISDLRTPIANSIAALAGMYISGGTSIGLYYNTIYLNATSSGTNFGSYGIYSSTTPTVDLRNNIVVNVSTPNGTGAAVAYRRSSTTLTSYSSNSNNNLFYCGTPGTTRLIYSDGTNSDETLGGFKTRVSPRDGASVTEDPPFVNVATTPYNIHIEPGSETQVESGGTRITSPLAITVDYDGNTRQGEDGYPGTGTAPDVGADEFEGTPADLTPPSILYTALGNGIVASSRNFTNVTITDVSGVNTTSGTRPRVYYKRTTDANEWNDNTNSTNGWKWVQANGTSNPFDFTINYDLLNGGTGVSLGDVVQYFVVAQDLAPAINVQINTGTFAATPTSVALTSAAFPIGGTPNSYSIVSTISGTITVGTDGDYATLTGVGGLFADINSKVVAGNITAQVISDITEGGTNALNQWSEEPNGSNFTLTIQPNSSTTRTISGSYAGGLIRLNGADRVTFDGRFGGSGNYLTITNTATTGTIAAIQLMSGGTGAGAINNTIRNCNISTGSNSITTSYGISVGGATIGTTGNDNDNTSILNNDITKCYYGVYAGAAAAGVNDNLIIAGNTIGSSNSADYVIFRGLNILGASAPSIYQNTIFNLQTTTSVNIAAIDLGSDVANADVYRNKIYGLRSTSTSGYGAYGINISSSTNNTANRIHTNLIYDIITANYSTSSTTFNAFGIRIAGGTNHKVYYNSVNLFGSVTAGSSAGMSAAFLVTANTITGLDVRNNIFANSTAFAVSGSKSYTAYVPTGTSFGTINYNDYYASGTYGILGYYGADRATITDWRTSSGGDLQSLDSNPEFQSNTDLRPNLGNAVLAGGTPIDGITIDYLGATRSPTTPSIGAYENGADVIGPAISYTNLSNTTYTSNRSFSGVTITDPSGVNTTSGTSPRVYYKRSTDANTFIDNTSGTDGWKWMEANGVSSPFDFTIDYSKLNGGTGVTTGSNVQYFVVAQDLQTPPYISINSGTFSAAPSSVDLTSVAFPIGGTINSYTILGSISGPVTVGTEGTYTTLTGAGGLFADINSKIVTGSITAQIISDITEDGTNALNQWTEEPSGSNFTLTIVPDGTTERVLSGTVANHMIRLNGADRVTIDGRYSGSGKYLRFRNTNISNSVIQFSNGATYNTLRNIYIEGAATSATVGVVQFSTGSNTNNTVTECEIRDRSDAAGKPYTGVYFGSTSNDNNTIFNSKIYNFSNYGVYISAGTNTLIDSSEIYMTSASSLTTVYGFYLSNASGTRIVKNKIFGLDGTSSATVKGVYYYGASGISMNVSIENNSISLSPNTTGQVDGIDYYGYLANSLDIYYNSIYLGGTVTSGTNSSACIRKRDEITNYNQKNNVLHNARTNSGGTGAHYSIAFTTATGTSQVLNYNDYYVSGTGGVLGIYVATACITLGDWQTASSFDANSLSGDPLFNSTSLLQPQTGSPVLAAGTPVSGITTDILNVARSGSTPSMGAYETGGDFAPPAISYTTLGNTTSTSNRTLSSVTITDATGVDWTNTPRIYYKKSTDENIFGGNTSGDNGWKWTAANESSSPTNFTINYSILFGGSASINDIIQYFVVAQDLVGTPNVGSNPSSGFVGTSVSSISSAPTTPNSYTISASFSGTITVGSSQTYTSLTADASTGLFKAINNGVFTGNVTVNIVSDLTETGAIALNQWSEEPNGSNFTLTIQPNSSTTRTISGSYAGGLIRLNGADRVTFDGRFSGSGNYLTISNTSTATNSAAFQVISLGTDAGAINNTIRNCNIKAGSNSETSTFGIFVGGTTISTTGTGAHNNNLAIQNNVIEKAFYGIYARGVATTGELSGLSILNNTIGSNTEAEYVTGYGMYFSGMNGAVISGNSIYNMIYNGLKYGMYLATNVSNSFFSKNKIYSFNQTNTTVYYSIGIYFSSSTGVSNNQIDNNAISDINYYGSTSNFYNAGIRLAGGDGYKIYYNSISMTGAFGSTTSGVFSHCLFISTAATNIDMRNNIFFNTKTGTSPKTYTVYTVASTTFTNIDYNDYYTSGSWIGYWNGAEITDFAAWKTATGSDVNSKNVNPQFTSTTNLQPQIGSGILASGTPIGGLTTDILGVARNGSTPSMGAYENGTDAPVITYTTLGPINSTTNRTLSNVTITTSSVGVDFTSNKPRIYYKKSTDNNVFGGNTSGDNGWKWTESNTGSSPTSFIINYSIINGGSVSTGDYVQYFIVAQNLAETPEVASNPSTGFVGTSVSAITSAPTTPNQYKIVGAPLFGDIQVGFAMFNKLTEKNLYFEKRTRKVMRDVPVGYRTAEKDARTKESQQTESKFLADGETEIIKSDSRSLIYDDKPASQQDENIIYELREVAEEYYVILENGIDYSGPHFYQVTSTEKNMLGIEGVYTTLTAAIADLNERGVSGNVRFLLTDATYSGETLPIVINVQSEAVPSSSATVTIKPSISITPTISGASASGPVIRVQTTNYVTIDGSNTDGGTTRDLTIQNTSTSSPNVIRIVSNGATAINNVTVKNCNLLNGSDGSTAFFVYDLAGSAGLFTNITIQNNAFKKAFNGIYLNAVSSSGNGSGTLITGNDMNFSGTDDINYIGIYLYQIDGSTISNNNLGNIDYNGAYEQRGIYLHASTKNSTVSGNNINNYSCTNTGAYAPRGILIGTGIANSNINVTGNTVSGLTTTGTGSTFGISLTGATSGITIQKNKIYNIKNTNSNGYSAIGIGLNSTLTENSAKVINNVIYDVAGYGYSSTTTDNGYGINVLSGGGYKIYNNSINLATNQTIAGYPACLIINSAVTTPSTLDIRNNIFSLQQTTGTERYTVLCNAANTVFTEMNYNDYYTLGSNLGYLGSARADLAAWRTATGKDVNSVSGNPSFTSSTNLMPNADDANAWVLNGTALYLTDVTDDFAGLARSSTAGVDIGAYEFTPSVAAPAATPSGAPSAGGTTTYSSFGQQVAAITWGSGTVPSTITLTRRTNTAVPNATDWNSNGKYSNTYWEITADQSPQNPFTAVFNLNSSEFGTISDPTNNLILAKKETGKPWVSFERGIGNYKSDVNWTNNTVTVTGLTKFSQFALTDKDNPIGGRNLNLTVLIEGLYTEGTNLMISDTLTVEIRNGSSPYALVESKKAVVGTNGIGSFNFFTAVNSADYYLAIKHRNSIQTWTKLGTNQFAESELAYNFTIAATQAYGDNMVQKGSKWCIFSGDVNQDGVVDLSDMIEVDNDNANFVTGYVVSDVNGDEVTDLSDMIIVDNNNAAFVGAQYPSGLAKTNNRKFDTMKKKTETIQE